MIVYVNWTEEEIISENEFQDRVNEVVAEIMEDKEEFSEICGTVFSGFELFHMDSKNENDIEKVKSVIREVVESDFNCDGWEKVEIEI